MHELPITQNILEIALRHAAQNDAQKITDLYLVIGQLSSVIDESIQFYWPIVSADTIAAAATIHFRRIPAQLQCQECQTTYTIPSGEMELCPNCESSQIHVIAGKEFQLESIGVE